MVIVVLLITGTSVLGYLRGLFFTRLHFPVTFLKSSRPCPSEASTSIRVNLSHACLCSCCFGVVAKSISKAS